MAKLSSINPADGNKLGSVKITTKAELEEVIEKAKAGFEKWREVPLVKKKKVMLKYAFLLKKQAKSLGKLISQEMGKPIREAVSEVKITAEEVGYLAELAGEILKDEVVEPSLTIAKIRLMERNSDEDRLDYWLRKRKKRVGVIRYMPKGVVGMIKPWNFPVELPSVAITSALMAGNSVVLKPSEVVPLVSNEIAKLIWQAGVPDDGFQIIHGRGRVGTMLVDADIDKISFTGSTETGKEIAEKCAPRLVDYTLELGGSSPAIVCKDADLELAVNGVFHQRFFNCGQVCSAVKRVIIEEPVADQFTKMLINKVKKLRVGDPLDNKTDIGPLASEKQLKLLQKQVTRAVVQSGRILEGGRRMRDKKHINGFYHQPTVMVYVRTSMDIMQEEVFGPVLPILKVENFEQAIEAANDTKYGLTAMIFTKSKPKAYEFFRKVEAGGLTVNEVDAWNVKVPFGGVKQSGVGVELGKHGIYEYVDKKYLIMDVSGRKSRDWWLKV